MDIDEETGVARDEIWSLRLPPWRLVIRKRSPETDWSKEWRELSARLHETWQAVVCEVELAFKRRRPE